ncbi:MAG: hypothetical protein HY287_03930 [Planctomycetes bacterium]|nr:hypothetical protein [Planctomycetota bacterium]MBI3833462.1 hypothetical protein [Planctomycetota bacterium]
MSNKPVKTFRDGAIGLSVWERQGKKGVFYDFTLSRSYKGGENGSAYASTFREDNAEAVIRVVSEAAAWIRERAAQNGKLEGTKAEPATQEANSDEPMPNNRAVA